MALIGSRGQGGLVKISVLSGGTNYTSPPTVVIAGGTGATAYAQIDAGRVASVVVASSGSGFTGSPAITFSGGGGTGAAATAFAYTGPAIPASFFKGRYGDMYAVDGMGRGLRWDGDSAALEPIGVQLPLVGPALTAATTANAGRVVGVQILDAGARYSSAPTVTFTGGTPTTSASARATITDGRVVSIEITSAGSGYQGTPVITLSGGQPTPPTLGVQVVGSVRRFRVTAAGTGYTTDATAAPTVVISTAQGLTQAIGTCSVNAKGELEGITVVSAGTGATASGVTASVTGGGGTGAAVAVDMYYRVSGVTVVSGGADHHSAPIITFRAATTDPTGGGAAATAYVNSAGAVTGATVYSGGLYGDIPSAVVLDTSAKAIATIAQPLVGKYKCCLRYVDDTSKYAGGPIPSSISDLVEIDCGTGSSSLTWTLSHPYAEPRVTAVELWRTSGDQSVLLFQVATIQRSDAGFTGTFTDGLSDEELTNPDRDGYALMPVTLPSGQINARRFTPPPAEFSVAAVFQDRAWYAADTSGERPNSLCYSEIDEPESVPDANELVVQENTGDTDKIVALVPLGSDLLVVQRSHIYKLNYVAQPVIDASIALAAYRGAINSRCWSVMGGVAFLADSNGLYAFDGSKEDPLSVPIDNLWRNGEIDFSKASKFHVSTDTSTKTVRFFYCSTADTEPQRALCYCIATKAWWQETYPVPITSSCVTTLSGKQQPLYGTAAGGFRALSGRNDSGSAIPYELRTGNFVLDTKDTSRSVSLVYSPTVNDSSLGLRLHYNNSSTPRANAVAVNTGHGFATTAGSTEATLNLKASRSALGDANGIARAYYSGRNDDRSTGGDRHVAIAVAGSQAGSASGDEVSLHGIVIEGAG